MNFSSSLMSGLGISLGGLEIATDYLFADPDLYEPDLTEVKTTISHKNPETIKVAVKPVKPKQTRESIIKKYDIGLSKVNVIDDEVIDDNTDLVTGAEDFDFTFGSQDKEEALRELDKEVFGEEEVITSLMLEKLNNVQSADKQADESDEEDLSDFYEEEEGEDENINDEDEEASFFGGDEEEREEEEFFGDEDADDSQEESINDEDEFFGNEDEDFFGNEDEEIEQLEVVENQEQVEIKHQESVEQAVLQKENPIKENSKPVINKQPPEVNIKGVDNKRLNANVESSNPSQINITVDYNNTREIEELKNEVAGLNKQIHDLKSVDAKKKADSLSVEKNKKLVFEKPKESIKKKEDAQSRIERYSEMDEAKLYIIVRNYMNKLGVQNRIIALPELNKVFGETNINHKFHF